MFTEKKIINAQNRMSVYCCREASRENPVSATRPVSWNRISLSMKRFSRQVTFHMPLRSDY
jgi:hypothetical protein